MYFSFIYFSDIMVLISRYLIIQTIFWLILKINVCWSSKVGEFQGDKIIGWYQYGKSNREIDIFSILIIGQLIILLKNSNSNA